MSVNIVRFLLLAVGLWVSAAQAQGISALRQFSTGLESLSAEFTQLSYDFDGNQELSRGRVWMQKPARLRWDYLTPYTQHIIADGQQVWTYDIDLEQVTVRDQTEALSRSALSALTDSSRLERYFELVDAGESEGLTWVRLIPKPQSAGEYEDQQHEFEEIRLGFIKNRLSQMQIADRLGQSTAIEFHRIQRNLSVDETLFQFTVPEGVDVIGDGDF